MINRIGQQLRHSWKAQSVFAFLASGFLMWLGEQVLPEQIIGVVLLPGFWVALLLFPSDIDGGANFVLTMGVVTLILIASIIFIFIHFLTRRIRLSVRR
jgi:hypothetical protein